MSIPKVAVITRTYNRPIFLKRALQSVSSQTFDDYVHVIINDGGDKKAVDNVVAALSDDQRARTQVFHRETSSGAPDTIFNESIDRVDSEYFAIHDDDDSWDTDFLKETVAFLDSNPDRAAVVVTTDKVVEELSGDEIKYKKRSRWMPDLSVISLYRQCKDNQFTPIATLFRRSAYEAVGKFDSTLPVVGDWEFGIRLLAKYEAGFLYSDHALANYHHRKSPTGSSFTHYSHREYVTLVANKYLRKELEGQYLGLGYIMSKLKYDEDQLHGIIKRYLPSGIVSWAKRRRN